MPSATEINKTPLRRERRPYYARRVPGLRSLADLRGLRLSFIGVGAPAGGRLNQYGVRIMEIGYFGIGIGPTVDPELGFTIQQESRSMQVRHSIRMATAYALIVVAGLWPLPAPALPWMTEKLPRSAEPSHGAPSATAAKRTSSTAAR